MALSQFLLAAVTAFVARRRGRSALGWGIAGLFIPFFALIALAILPNLRRIGAGAVAAPLPGGAPPPARTTVAPQNPGWNKPAPSKPAPAGWGRASPGWGKSSASAAAGMKKCPKCSKMAPVAAQACPYCRFDFNQQR
jgi:hypothetical protein